MDSAKISDWMQVVGIFALVASLVFVGMQMQQDREIARVMIYQSRASTLAEISMAAASSPEAIFLPAEHWASVKSALVSVVSTVPFLQLRMEAILDQQRPAFRDELMDILRAAEAKRSE
jgi:hypothetical protein